MSPRGPFALAAAIAASAFGVSRPTHAWQLPIPVAVAVAVAAPSSPESAPAVAYGRLDAGACQTELLQRGVTFTPVGSARGVLVPIRLEGPLHGVSFHTAMPASARETAPWEIVDCRLALALDDFAAQLARHDVVDVVHFSIYRPPVASWPDGKLASRHPGAMAIDAATFVKRDGTRLDVLHDFHGRIGATTCGPAAGPRPSSPEALELRAIVCDAAAARLFNVVLTPDFNWPHRNHFHLEVTAGKSWFVVH